MSATICSIRRCVLLGGAAALQLGGASGCSQGAASKRTEVRFAKTSGQEHVDAHDAGKPSAASPGIPPEWRAQVDPQRASEVPVVLRVRLLSREGGNKYEWDRVKRVAVIKNLSSFHFPDELSIAHDSGEPGIPDGESTVYLEHYQDIGDTLWKLLDGSGRRGVSHPSKAP